MKFQLIATVAALWSCRKKTPALTGTFPCQTEACVEFGTFLYNRFGSTRPEFNRVEMRLLRFLLGDFTISTTGTTALTGSRVFSMFAFKWPKLARDGANLLRWRWSTAELG